MARGCADQLLDWNERVGLGLARARSAEEWRGCAGGYRVESAGQALFDKLSLGLVVLRHAEAFPVARQVQLLRYFGVHSPHAVDAEQRSASILGVVDDLLKPGFSDTPALSTAVRSRLATAIAVPSLVFSTTLLARWQP